MTEEDRKAMERASKAAQVSMFAAIVAFVALLVLLGIAFRPPKCRHGDPSIYIGEALHLGGCTKRGAWEAKK